MLDNHNPDEKIGTLVSIIEEDGELGFTVDLNDKGNGLIMRWQEMGPEPSKEEGDY